jgi:tetratricopeptide (TPR) repeat protein
MLMISLKAYNREIEQLIDNGQYDEAVAHSIHILSIYPKCIEAYRNLGKSLLEQKKYPEALDVFSRVLSAIPEDFISHVGLSIIFEDQTNLDLAIWHMEQAFDVQPSNLAVQDELKRLFGLRDGEQPAKIRLTRGALVRMYSRGELFQQAITEILSILEEDPRRIDLEAILARMHYLSGAIEEAEADCNRLLEKIPYCFDANKILYQISIDRNNSEESKIYLNRLISLDPYYQFVSSTFSDEEIPENKVLLEKLDYIPVKNSNSQIPVWNEDTDTSTHTMTKEIFNRPNSSPINEDAISYLAGNPFLVNDKVIENNVVNNSMLSDDEFPEWIKDAGLDAESEFLTNNSNDIAALNSLHTQPLNSEALDAKQSNEYSPKVVNEDIASLFTELKEGKMSDQIESSNGNEEKQFPPSEWMSQFSNSEDSSSSNSSDQDFPDWLKNFQDEDPNNVHESDDMPEWLKNLQSEGEPTSQPSDVSGIESQLDENEKTTFDNLFTPDDVSEGTVDTVDSDEIPQLISEGDDQWEKVDLPDADIKESGITKTESEETLSTSSDDTIPDWVKSVLIDQNPNDQSSAIPESESVTETDPAQMIASTQEDQSEISSELEEIVDSVTDFDEGIISQQTNDELLDWLRGLKTEEVTSPQNEESLSLIEDSANISNNMDQEPGTGILPVEDIMAANEPEIDNEIDLELIRKLDEEKEQITSGTEILQDQSLILDQSDATEVEYTEYANELLETSAISDSVEGITDEEIIELISKQDFDTLSNKILQLSEQNQEIDTLLSSLSSSEKENHNNFAYWQCLGDIYSKKNQLNEALFAYQKAEEILLNTISS